MLNRRLTERMFVNGDKCFGLQHNQARSDENRVLPYCRWFNQRGEFLGSGALSHGNLFNIYLMLHPDDIFAIVHEHEITERSISVEELVKRCSYFVAPDGIFYIDAEGEFTGRTSIATGILIKVIDPNGAKGFFIKHGEK